MHIGFYDRGVDAKSTPVRDPGTLGDLHHLAMQLLDHLGPERLRDLQNRLRVRHVARINARQDALAPLSEADVSEALDVIADVAVDEWLRATNSPYQISGDGERDDIYDSALGQTSYGTTTREVVIVERPVYTHYVVRHIHGYHYYSPWGYDGYGWFIRRPILHVSIGFGGRHRIYYDPYRYRDRYRYWDRDRYRYRDRDRNLNANRHRSDIIPTGWYDVVSSTKPQVLSANRWVC